MTDISPAVAASGQPQKVQAEPGLPHKRTGVYHLQTGDPDLDQLLAIDESTATKEDRRTHGILCEVRGAEQPVTGVAPGAGLSKPGDPRGGVPIVLILGAAGTGKTTLALQIATEIATDHRKAKKDQNRCRVFFYSLEQSRKTLDWAHERFGFKVDAEFLDLALEKQPKVERGKIHLCHFAPLPIADNDSTHAFEDRFKQLCHMTDEVIKALDERKTAAGPLPVFILDSLNAIATSDLPRNDVHRLFALFRSRGIPAIVTAELREGPVGGGSSQMSEDARFLADIVMELTAKESPGSLLRYLQISKSRVRRQALGKHFYRIETVTKKEPLRWPMPKPDSRQPPIKIPSTQASQAPEPTSGFLLYPSLPSIVHMTRAKESQSKEAYYRLYDEPGEYPHSIYKLMQGNNVKAGACFSLVGPAGTHKLALGLNLATGYRSKKETGRVGTRKLLVISFGSYTAVDLAGVAWFSHRSNWRKLDQPGDPEDPRWAKVSFQLKKGAKFDDSDGPFPEASQLIFRMGHLTPEECFYRIQREIDGGHYSAALVWDTAQISTGFPLLRAEALFLPSLIDLFHQFGLVSVFIGVREEHGANREMDFGLESAADYRLCLSHYPTAYALAKDIFVRPLTTLIGRLPVDEQLVSVVLDNVTGKHYGRHPRWLMVKGPEKGRPQHVQPRPPNNEKQTEPKTLLCLDTAECTIELARRAVSRAQEDANARCEFLARLSPEELRKLQKCVDEGVWKQWQAAADPEIRKKVDDELTRQDTGLSPAR